MFQVDEGRLRALMAERGIRTYQELAERAQVLGVKFHWRTIYNLIADGNWTRSTLEALCKTLDCTPSELIAGWVEEQPYTHATPRPIQEPEIT